jgi:TRAP-type uncharacterized transport system substrate-binding protein
MKKLTNTLYSTAILLASVTLTQAEDLKIGAGSETGEYTKTIVPAIGAALKQYGYNATPEISAGSQDNIDKVMAGNLPAALSQLDVAALNMTPEKDPQENLVLMGKISPEALFCAAKKGGSIRTYADLTDDQKQPLKIGVGDEKSGTARTFEYLMKLDAKLKKSVELTYKPEINMEINRLLSGRRDLVCFVMMPNPDNELIQMVVNNEELFFLEINNPLFTKAQVGKVSVYDVMEVPVSKGILGFGTKKVKTLVTWVGVVVNTAKTDPKLSKALNTVVMKDDLLPASSLAAKTKKMLLDFAKMIGK